MACFHLPGTRCDECRELVTMIAVSADGLSAVYEENKMLREELEKVRRECNLLRSALSDIAKGACFCDIDRSDLESQLRQCDVCKAKKALSKVQP